MLDTHSARALICVAVAFTYACGGNRGGRDAGRIPIDAQRPDTGPGVDAQLPDAGTDEDGGTTEDATTTGDATTTADAGPIEIRCGDGIVGGTETCDPSIAFGMPGACPTSCDDGLACTTDTLMGASSTCDARCETADISACTVGDGCCPTGCTSAMDADCSCTARTTCAAGECGTVDNGCGGPLECGSCSVGGTCDTNADCGSGVCITEPASGWPGGYCSVACMGDADCGAGSHCGYIAADGFGACLANCTTGGDCRTNYSCRNADEDTRSIRECAPTATGAGATGAACTDTSQCSGADTGWCIVEARGWLGGYCTRECMADTDCVGDSHCGFRDTVTGRGACVANCTGGCRMPGYACWDIDTDMRSECAPAATGSEAVGAACNTTFECAGGTDGFCITQPEWADGYCTVLNCAMDTDCPGGSHCTRFGTDATGYCFSNCTMDSQCRSPGYGCWDANDDGRTECYVAATGIGAVGTACELTRQCAGGSRGVCATEANAFRHGYCALRGCTAGGTGMTGCPTGSHCSMGIGETEGICAADCGFDADCRADGYRCWDSPDVDTATECWPAGTGTGAVGAPCAGSWDCGGEEVGLCITQQTDGTWPGGYCTRTCGTCPTGSMCVPVDAMGTMLCLDECTGAGMGDCRATYACTDTGAGTSVCVTPPAP